MAYSIPLTPALLTLLLMLIYLRQLRAWMNRSRGRPLPPTPPGLPLIGNLLNIPKTKQWLGYQELAAVYGMFTATSHRRLSQMLTCIPALAGDIIHFRTMGNSIVVLGSASMIMEYLDKRTANTSDRKQSVLIEL